MAAKTRRPSVYCWYTNFFVFMSEASEATQFKTQEGSLCRKPICTKFLPEHDSALRALENRGAYIREAVVRALETDGLV